ncbi:unnamed protein product [Pieris brassicae]|uniref:Secreted protein n=1 Tax=Pieris brassicae TaxID=7116 RepID=A0A9P0WU48_PIEBR|nr:unnamed protein product [Pieris brassicae]
MVIAALAPLALFGSWLESQAAGGRSSALFSSSLCPDPLAAAVRHLLKLTVKRSEARWRSSVWPQRWRASSKSAT